MTITITSPFVSRLYTHFENFFARFHAEPEGYVFQLDLEEETLRRFRYLYLAYLNRNPTRYVAVGLRGVPEFATVLDALEPRDLCGLTCYVIARLAQARDRFDFQRYSVDYRLLEELLALAPWADEEDMCRIGEALYFMSPFGYEGVIYWPLGAYLTGISDSCAGQPASPRLTRVLTMMDNELRIEFAYGYAAEVAHCQLLLQGLLWPVAEEKVRYLVAA